MNRTPILIEAVFLGCVCSAGFGSLVLAVQLLERLTTSEANWAARQRRTF